VTFVIYIFLTLLGSANADKSNQFAIPKSVLALSTSLNLISLT